MCIQPFRLAGGGLIDRSSRLAFSFDGVALTGHAGDTLGSALLASALRLKPQQRSGAKSLVHSVVNGYAFPIPLVQGLAAGRRPTEPAAICDPAGNELSAKNPISDPDTQVLDCDVAVIGGGAAGLTAAIAAGKTGARVILLDQCDELGGWLLHERRFVDGQPAQLWVNGLIEKVKTLANVCVYSRSTATEIDARGCVHGFTRLPYGPMRPGGHLATHFSPFEVLPKALVLATGATEVCLPVSDTPKAGVYLSSTARGYANRYAAACARRILIATDNDSGYLTALDLVDAGVSVAAIVDERPSACPIVHEQAQQAGLDILFRSSIREIRYRGSVEAVEVIGVDGKTISILCDGLAISGGLVPVVDLLNRAALFEGDAIPLHVSLAGSCAGAFALKPCLSSAAKVGADAAIATGFMCRSVWIAPRVDALLNMAEIGADPNRQLAEGQPWAPRELMPYRLEAPPRKRVEKAVAGWVFGALRSTAALTLLSRAVEF